MDALMMTNEIPDNDFLTKGAEVFCEFYNLGEILNDFVVRTANNWDFISWSVCDSSTQGEQMFVLPVIS